jgi:hypothetical protein
MFAVTAMLYQMGLTVVRGGIHFLRRIRSSFADNIYSGDNLLP